jgi:hypothetical protein
MMVLQQFVSLMISIIILYFVYRAYDYLGNLESCECAPQVYVERLKWTEIAYLVIYVCGITVNVLGMLFGLKFGLNVPIAFLYFIVILGLFTFFIYNVYEYSQQLDPSCECSNQWQNRIIYAQALYYMLPLVMMGLGYLMGFDNVPFLVLITVIILLTYFYEKFVIENGVKKTESMVSRLGIFDNMVMQPNLFADVCNTPAKKTTASDFSPWVGQPTQRYRQIKPCEVYAPKNGEIITPYSTHETIVRGYRKNGL